MGKTVRILVAKPGLDGHDMGARLVCQVLRDAGMEVIYTGLRQSVEAIVSAAIQEDVDIVGLSILSGAHIGLTQKVMAALARENAADIDVVVGGLILKGDKEKLIDMGVKAVFESGSTYEEIQNYFRNL